MQQMKADVVVFNRRIELDRDGDQTKGEDAARDGVEPWLDDDDQAYDLHLICYSVNCLLAGFLLSSVY